MRIEKRTLEEAQKRVTKDQSINDILQHRPIEDEEGQARGCSCGNKACRKGYETTQDGMSML